ncbi:MAG: DUF4399 domain-containing protein [Pseudomonadota bacterium]
MLKNLLAASAVALVTAGAGLAQMTMSPEGAEVYFVNLSDGDTVSGPVKVVFGLSGMGVAPSGTEKENTGHHHLLINREALGENEFGDQEFMEGLPNDENHRHFGGGQTEVTLDLPPGEHTLQLVLGDANHIPHDPPIMSDVITITVE